jgi:predicted transcriptional regulator
VSRILKGANANFGFRRSHEQVLVDILRICETPKHKTHVLHNTNTNFKLLQSYLLQLQAAQLIEIVPEKTRYATTKKGLKYLKTWTQLKQMMRPLQIEPPIVQRMKRDQKEKLLTLAQ